MTIRAGLSALFLLFLLSGLMALRTGDFSVRLASNDDIIPLSYAYYWEYPERFARDILSTYARDYTLSTLSNWLPALLLRAVRLAPETSSWALLYLQNALLGLAAWRYTWLATRRAGLAWLAVFFAYAAQPWCWNLANYGSKLFAPYPGQLALPFLLFAACAVLEGRSRRVIGWLALSGLIHPSLTLYMLAVVGVYWLWAGRHDLRRAGPRLIGLAGAASFCVAPAFYVRLTGGEAAPAAALMRLLQDNLHAIPWRHETLFGASALSFAGSVALALLGLRHYRCAATGPFDSRAWFAAVGLACALFAAALAAGLLLASPLILQLTPLRATLLWPLLTLPWALGYLAERATNERFVIRWSALAILLLAAAFVYGLAWGPLIVLALHDLADGRWLGARPGWSRRLRRASAGLLALWLGAGLAAMTLPSWPVPPVAGMLPTVVASTIQLPGVRLNSIPAAVVIVAGMAGGIACALAPGGGLARAAQRVACDRAPRQAGLILLVALLFGVATFKAWRAGAETRQPMARALYQAQLWARAQTPETAGFIAFGLGSAWRPISRRWTIDPRPTGWYLYAGGQATKAFDDAYLDFYGLGADGDVAAAYRSLDEAGILRLAQRFGGDYIVRPVEEPLKLPEVYRNEGYIIYRLTDLK
jgi:hypothetical protein